MIAVSRTTRRAAQAGQAASVSQGPPPPTPEQAAASELRVLNIETILGVCAGCSARKLGRNRIANMHQDVLVCNLVQHSYKGQLPQEDLDRALGCPVPTLFAQVWRHEAGRVAPEQVQALAPDWNQAPLPVPPPPTPEQAAAAREQRELMRGEFTKMEAADQAAEQEEPEAASAPAASAKKSPKGAKPSGGR